MFEKAEPLDFPGRWREIIADPLNLFIERVEDAGKVEGGLVTLHNGHRVPLEGPFAYYKSFSKVLVFNRGVHEPLEEFVFQEALRKLTRKPVMLELGALWAHYSMWLLQARPEGRAYMVEADPVGLEAGQRNFALHGYRGVFEQGFVKENGVTVDDFVLRHGIAHLDILHVDIQGFEVSMLKGARATFDSRKVDYAFISTHGNAHHKKVTDWLRTRGYRIDVSSGWANHTTSFDGFILAVRPDLPRFLPDMNFMGRQKINGSTAQELARYVNRLSRRLELLHAAPALPTQQADAI
jgi:hypothetical protein